MTTILRCLFPAASGPEVHSEIPVSPVHTYSDLSVLGLMHMGSMWKNRRSHSSLTPVRHSSRWRSKMRSSPYCRSIPLVFPLVDYKDEVYRIARDKFYPGPGLKPGHLALHANALTN